MDFLSQKQGMSDPPHRSSHQTHNAPVGSARRSSDEELTQVRKLRYKNTAELMEVTSDKHPMEFDRDHSDVYLESNLRTPRCGTQANYNDMIESLHEQGQFSGDYRPSEKSKKSKSKKHKRDKDRSQDGSSTLTVSDPLSRSSKRQCKGINTMKDEDKDSIDEIRQSKKGPVGFLKKRTSRRSSLMFEASSLNQESLRDFVKQNKIRIGDPKSSEKHHDHPYKLNTHSVGIIKFEGFGSEVNDSPYLRCAPDTEADIVWDMMINQWHLDRPQLVISVTGGAKRFNMKPKMQETFKRGLMKASTSTCAWIITGGTKTGVMEFVGDAVKDHIITSGRKMDVVVIGVATWGCVANRQALDGEKGQRKSLFPAVYSKRDVMKDQSCSKNVPLHENHSHFILIDNGKTEFGGEIKFRTSLEKFISEQKLDPDDKESCTSLTIPMISIIVEGGINSMETVWRSVKARIPVLVLKSSGRAADFIAHGYNFANKLKSEKNGKKRFNEEMEKTANRLFEWKEKDLPKKDVCVKELRKALKHREMLTVLDLNDYDQAKDFDKAILNALLKAMKSNINAQLSLAEYWNRPDIAENEIFTASNKNNQELLKLDDFMMRALIQDSLEFVKLFLENGIELSKFLDIRNLWNLYSNSLNDTHLLWNKINYLKQTWAEYLCCKDVKDNGGKTDLLNDIGMVISNILRYKDMNMYQGDKFVVCNKEAVVDGYIPRSEMQCSHDYSGKEEKSKMHCRDLLKNPAKHLFIWAVLMNRMSLAKFFFRVGSDHIGAALFASCLLQKLSDVAEEEIELSLTLKHNSSEFEKLASEILSICYLKNRNISHQLLIRQLSEFGNTTPFYLAGKNNLMDFMGQTCCQTKLNAIWKGHMALYTSSRKIVASIIIPFLIPFIRFFDKKKASSGKYDDLVPLYFTEEDLMLEQDSVNKNLTGSNGKTVTVCGGDNNWSGDLNLFRAIFLFYTAPVTKFTTAMFADIVFLGLFSFFVLTDLHPIGENGAPSLVEIFSWIYTITSAMEEFRQVLTKDQQSFWYKIRSWYDSLWNRLDFLMYLSFFTSVILRFSLYGEDFIWARMLYSLTLGMHFIRFMRYFYAEKNIGPKVIIIYKMITDLMFFLLILLVFILSFGVAYQANLYPNAPQQWSVLKDVLYHPYWQMYGELFLENKEGNDPSEKAETCTHNETLWRSGEMDRCPEKNAMVVLLMVVYMLLTNILLVNLLIAMFSDTFKRVQNNSEKVWRFHRFSLVHEYCKRPTLVPPLIILNLMYRAIKQCTQCGDNGIYTRNGFKLKLNNEDHNKLSKFEREAMEEYMHSLVSLENDKIERKMQRTSERMDRVIGELGYIKDNVMARVIRELGNIKDNVMAKQKVFDVETSNTAWSTSISNIDSESSESEN